LLIENPAYILINCTGPGHEHMADGWSLYEHEPPPPLVLDRHPPSEPPPVVGKRYLVGWKSGTMQTVTCPERRWPDGIAWWAEVPREESDG
jgi:hypothetical protein